MQHKIHARTCQVSPRPGTTSLRRFRTLYRMSRTAALLVLLSLAFSLLPMGCGKGNPGPEGASGSRRDRSGRSAETAAIPVKTEPVVRGEITDYVETHTRLEAERWVNVVARASGLAQELLVEEGDSIEAGAILVRLDKAELSLGLRRAATALEQARSDFDRTREMFELNFISESEFDVVRLKLESSDTAFEEARLNLDYADISAPIAGVVMRRAVETGDMVRVSDSVFAVADLDPLLARIYIPEKRIGQVRVNQEARILIDMFADEHFQGSVRMISPGVNPETGTVKVTLEIPTADPRLRPGMFATVRIITERHLDALMIPKKALVLETDEDDVFVVREEKAYRVRVTLGFADGERVEVLEGLKDGEPVVTIGHEGLKDGTPVREVGGRARRGFLPGSKPEAQSSNSGR